MRCRLSGASVTLTATLGYWSPAAGAYVGGTGKVLPLPLPRSGRSVT